MSNYHGYWFYGLKNDEIIQAKDLVEEYLILNCPQEYAGPFKDKALAEYYKLTHPNASIDFNKNLNEYYKFCYGEEI